MAECLPECGLGGRHTSRGGPAGSPWIDRWASPAARSGTPDKYEILTYANFLPKLSKFSRCENATLSCNFRQVFHVDVDQNPALSCQIFT
jgi:hypothetical protein